MKENQTLAEYISETLSDLSSEATRRLAKCHVQNEPHFQIARDNYSKALEYFNIAVEAEDKGLQSERALTGMEDV
jgi:hypothetical protein